MYSNFKAVFLFLISFDHQYDLGMKQLPGEADIEHRIHAFRYNKTVQ